MEHVNSTHEFVVSKGGDLASKGGISAGASLVCARADADAAGRS